MRKFLFALLVILVSCNPKSDSISIVEAVTNVTNQDLLAIDSEASFVQLETTEECLLDHIINIEVTRDFIYVLDRQTFYIFSNKGEFIKKIITGRGPGELSRAVNFSVDLKRNEISIIAEGRFLHIYNLNAEFIETHKLEGSFSDAIRIDDENFLLHTTLPAIYEDHLISVYNLKTKSITKKYISTDEIEMKNLAVLTFNNFSVIDDEIFYSASNSRNIYKYSDEGMKLFKKIDFKDLNPNETYTNKFDGNAGAFMKQSYIDNYIGFINYYYHFEKFSLVGLKYKDYNCGIIYEEDPSKLYLTTFSEIFNLPQMSSFRAPKNANKNQIYFVYYNDLITNEETQSENMILEIDNKKIQIQENANPLIVTLNIED